MIFHKVATCVDYHDNLFHLPISMRDISVCVLKSASHQMDVKYRPYLGAITLVNNSRRNQFIDSLNKCRAAMLHVSAWL